MSRYRIPVVVHAILVRAEQVLLLRRAGTGFGDGCYGLPAGHLEPGESVLDAVIRETFEEVGVELAADHLGLVTTMHRRGTGADFVDLFFAASRFDGEPKIGEPDKCDELSWHPRHRLPDNTLPYLPTVLREEFRQGRLAVPGW